MPIRNKPLSEFLETVDQKIFWTDSPGGVPHYKAILGHLLGTQYPDGLIPVSDIYTDRYPNPSSFQRAVAKEAQRRREEL